MSEHYELGKKGEEEAANFLTKKGFYIMHRNWRCGKLELDIVAGDGDEIVFVEVKTRRNTYFGYPDEAIDDRKIRRIVSAAGAYVRYYSINLPIRYDVVSVIGMEPPFEIEHVPDAFFPPMWNR